MTSEIGQKPSLTDEAKAIIWRIFGAGTSPFTLRSPYDLIERVVKKHLTSNHTEHSILVIRTWFDSDGNQQWLKSNMHKEVAVIILDGVRSERTETAIWAVGSIDAEVILPLIRSLWSCEEIDSLVDGAFTVLEKSCKHDRVLDVSRITGFFSVNAIIAKDAVEREGKIETFRKLDSNGFDFVHRSLYPAIGNLLALVVGLRPEQFGTLIERLDHPVMQARAADHMVTATRHLDHCATLQWITGSCDSLIALSIIHTLNTVNLLDNELQLADRTDADGCFFSTELGSEQNDLDRAAIALINGLVERLAMLESQVCVRWIGELLVGAPYILHQGNDNEVVPRRISQLERACMTLCACLIRNNWSDDLLAELIVGLRHTPRTGWIRHLVELAWKIRDVEPVRAAEIAKIAFDEHKRVIAMERERSHVFLDGQDWHQRQHIISLGIALAMSCENLDLPYWVRAQCRDLPLSVWDAEETHEAFSTAHRVVQHWFLVAFNAIPILIKLGHPAEPSAVRELAETFWSHCSFAKRHLNHLADVSTVSEYTARCAIEYGVPSTVWLLKHLRNPGLGPRSLWALLDQTVQKNTREGGAKVHDDEMIVTEFSCIVSDRFGDGTQYDLETLRYWGLLWLLLGSVDEAEKTATTILAFPLTTHDRVYKIIALRLLALVARSRMLSPMLANHIVRLYRELWPGYAPLEELTDRRLIDEMLKLSVSRIF
ncbi:MAG: hypothetical protein OXG56_01195 [Gammaproteobacteria bacterium]|nr:hypothetical protein [Gammaproteobacteria bacterium]